VVYDDPNLQSAREGSSPGKDRFKPKIRFGLGAVRGVGQVALDGVFEARSQGGPFTDLFDFAARVDSRRLNRGLLEALVQCGAFDAVSLPAGLSRARLFAAIERAMDRSRSATRDRERGQITLFGTLGKGQSDGALSPLIDQYPAADSWDSMELLAREKAALGCYVSGHPLTRYRHKLQRLDIVATTDLAGCAPWTSANVAGMVEDYQERLFKGGAGGKAGYFSLDDLHGRVGAKIRSDRIDTFADLLRSGEPVIVTGKVSFPQSDDEDEDREPTLLVDSVQSLSAAVERVTRGLCLRISPEHANREIWSRLKEVIAAHPGNCGLEIVVHLESGAEVVLGLNEAKVSANNALLGALERVLGSSRVEMI
jgi:DNA polymerase-3 subunit alpha